MRDDDLALVPRQARRFQGEPAGLVTRSLAVLVDVLVVGAVLVVLYAGFHVVLFMAEPREFEFVSVSLGLGVLAALVASALYLTGAWTATGRTYGNRVMGLRVVDRHRRPLRLHRSLLRALCCVGFPLGLVWSLASATRSSLQDLLLGTAVLYDWPPHHGDDDLAGRRRGPDAPGGSAP